MSSDKLEGRKVAALEGINSKLVLIAIILSVIAGVCLSIWTRY
jgi:hypothetical protein